MQKKLYKVEVRYAGQDTYIFEPCKDKSNKFLNAGSMTVQGDDESMRKFFQKHQFKNTDVKPDSYRSMKYLDMVLGVKVRDIRELWVWSTEWLSSNKKIQL